MSWAEMWMFTKGGPKRVVVDSPLEASDVGRHWSAIQHYRSTGDPRRIWDMEGATAGGEEFEADLDPIDEWHRIGDWGFEDIYDV